MKTTKEYHVTFVDEGRTQVYTTQVKLANEFNVTKSSIGKIINGKQRTLKGHNILIEVREVRVLSNREKKNKVVVSVLEAGLANDTIRPVPGFRDTWVSKDGETIITHSFMVKGGFSLWNIRKQSVHKYLGYMRVGVTREGETEPSVEYTHRLVAQTWIPDPNNYNEINHIDEDKTNNHMDNLEWCTHRHNLDHSNVIAKMHSVRAKTPLTDQFGNHYETVFEAAQVAGVAPGTIHCHIQGQIKAVGKAKYVFSRVNPKRVFKSKK